MYIYVLVQYNNSTIIHVHNIQTLLYLQVKFVMSDETSLADLLALNLHNFEEEVNTCTLCTYIICTCTCTCLSTDSNSCMYIHM